MPWDRASAILTCPRDVGRCHAQEGNGASHDCPLLKGRQRRGRKSGQHPSFVKQSPPLKELTRRNSSLPPHTQWASAIPPPLSAGGSARGTAPGAPHPEHQERRVRPQEPEHARPREYAPCAPPPAVSAPRTAHNAPEIWLASRSPLRRLALPSLGNQAPPLRRGSGEGEQLCQQAGAAQATGRETPLRRLHHPFRWPCVPAPRPAGVMAQAAVLRNGVADAVSYLGGALHHTASAVPRAVGAVHRAPPRGGTPPLGAPLMAPAPRAGTHWTMPTSDVGGTLAGMRVFQGLVSATHHVVSVWGHSAAAMHCMAGVSTASPQDGRDAWRPSTGWGSSSWTARSGACYLVGTPFMAPAFRVGAPLLALVWVHFVVPAAALRLPSAGDPRGCWHVAL